MKYVMIKFDKHLFAAQLPDLPPIIFKAPTTNLANGPPTPMGSNPLPPPIFFLPTPAPFFSDFFYYDFFIMIFCPRPSDTRPFFAKSNPQPPTPPP